MASFTSHVPAGKSASVRIIDSTSKIANFSPDVLMGPPIPGLDLLPDLCTWSFLVENVDGRRILFDLGIPVDWQDMAPAVSDRLKSKEWKISVEEPTINILNKHDIKPDSIEAIVWSHWHWDVRFSPYPSPLHQASDPSISSFPVSACSFRVILNSSIGHLLGVRGEPPEKTHLIPSTANLLYSTSAIHLTSHHQLP